MKKRPNSQKDHPGNVSSTSHSMSSINPSTRNYLSMLKQLSTSHKTAKAMKKSDPNSSFLKSPNLRDQASKAAGQNDSAEQKIKSILYPFSHKANIRKKSNPSIPSDIQSNNSRRNKAVDAKTSDISFNEKESNLSTNIVKNGKPIPKTRALGGLFCLSNGSQKNEQFVSSLLAPTHIKKQYSVASLDLTSTAKPSDSLLLNQQGKSSISEVNFDNFSRDKEWKRGSQGTISDFFNESLEIFKECKTPGDGLKLTLNQTCQFHPKKQAKYYTFDKNELNIEYKLCSKCAVALADKGAKVREIIFTEEELRKSEIESFMIKIAHSKQNSINLTQLLKTKKDELINFFNKQIEKAEEMASSLQNLIKEELENALNVFETQKKQVINAISAAEQKLNTETKEIDEMNTDIKQNLENILKHIELKPFEEIMSSYEARLKESDACFDSVREQKLDVFRFTNVRSEYLEDAKSKIRALLELQGSKTSMLKRAESVEKEENPSLTDASGRRVTRNDSLMSLENKSDFGSPAGSLFEIQHDREKSPLGQKQTEKLGTATQIEVNRTNPSVNLDTEASNLTLKTPQARHTSDVSSGETYRLRKIIGCGAQDGLKISHGSQVYDCELAIVHSSRSSCHLNETITIRQATSPEWENLGINQAKISQNQAYILTEPNPHSSSRNKSDYTADLSVPVLVNRDSIMQGSLRKNAQIVQEEGHNNNLDNSLSFSENKFKCYPFARRKTSRENVQRQTKSQNNSFNYPEEGVLLNHKVAQKVYQGPRCSPKFREKFQ